jgi:Domain of unknown function (DUF4382)
VHFNCGKALAIATVLGLILSSSCGGGGSSSSGGGGGGGGGGGTPNGSVSFSMTDLASDEIATFQVDVTSLQLKKADNTVVSVISSPVTVDLATLTNATALMNLITIPAGVYTSATITLDFTNAVCVLVGQTTPAALEDDTGAPITGTLAIPIQLGTSELNLVANTQRLLEFDFAVDESAAVDSVGNTVKLEPTLLFRLDGSGKTMLTFGTLVSVDTAGSTFVADVGSLHTGVLGPVTYVTSSTTVFHVDGMSAQGAPGLALLNAKIPGTWVQTFGAIDPASSHIIVTTVEAGVGTYNGGTDFIEGHITDRVGNPSPGSNVTFNVLGRSSNAAHTTLQYDTPFTVTTNFTNTSVLRRFAAQTFDTDSLNVGQHIRIFGSLSGTSMNASTTGSLVVLEQTKLLGTANGAIASSVLTMNLQDIDFRPQNLFTWADSGASSPTPSAFTVNVGTLGNALSITSGTPVEAQGFLAPISSSTQDATASTLVDLSAAPSLMLVKNLPAGLTVGATTSSSQVELTITGTAAAGELTIIDQGFAGTTMLPFTPAPTVQPAASVGLFVIRDKTTGAVSTYTAFDAFSTALGNALTLGATLKIFGALGAYNSGTNTMQATLVCVVVQ